MIYLLRPWYRQEQSHYIQRLLVQRDFEKLLGADDMRQCRIRNRAFLKKFDTYA